MDQEDIVTLIKKLMKSLGLNESTCMVYAILAVSDKPMTVGEIAEKTGYSIPMVYKCIKELVENNLIEKIKFNSTNVYSANINFIDVFEKRRKRLMEEFLEPLSRIDIRRYPENKKIKEIKDYAKEIYNYFKKINDIKGK
ncbi:MAG: helix-turn-helix domain-containing protein [Thermoplasmata archaeon]|nr:winged helix-turn-helix transcriptional regulator [Thermoplasmata archaeon]MVT13489.1 winged helix-turn-helix transcriptional regulator [Euryarchaeota archaeon]MVT15079.1 winged helix-turn-helix transcriptional regulator [Euryarchaeota archaeon]MVT35519.1 winged helix-turn-helix transcriptional regulator [Euryarchaeota archaeon]